MTRTIFFSALLLASFVASLTIVHGAEIITIENATVDKFPICSQAEETQLCLQLMIKNRQITMAESVACQQDVEPNEVAACMDFRKASRNYDPCPKTKNDFYRACRLGFTTMTSFVEACKNAEKPYACYMQKVKESFRETLHKSGPGTE